MGIWMPSVPFPYSGRVSPSGPAARAVYTQAVTVPPPTIGFGVRTSPSGLIEMFAVIGVPPVEAEIVAVVAEVTPFVVTVNVTTVDPAGITTVAGTVAEALFEERVMVVPPTGAGVASVTVPTDGFPAETMG